MPTIRFHLTSSLAPAAALAVLTDFGPGRAENWPTIDDEHFAVHARGEDWAEVTEGTASAWERARYTWNVEERRVDIETIESKVFGPGGGWSFRFTPEGEGTRVDVELTRKPRGFVRMLLAALLPIVGPSSLRTSFRAPFQAI